MAEADDFLTRFKSFQRKGGDGERRDPLLPYMSRLQDVPELITKVIQNHEYMAYNRPLNIQKPVFADSEKVRELVALLNGVSARLRMITENSDCLAIRAKEVVRHGCVYVRGRMHDFLNAFKALESFADTLDSIRTSAACCEHDIQSIQQGASATASLFLDIAHKNLSVVHADRVLLGMASTKE